MSKKGDKMQKQKAEPKEVKVKANEFRALYNMYNHWDQLLNYMAGYFEENTPEYQMVLSIMDKVEGIIEKRKVH